MTDAALSFDRAERAQLLGVPETALNDEGGVAWGRIFLPFALGYYLSYLLRTVNAVISPA